MKTPLKALALLAFPFFATQALAAPDCTLPAGTVAQPQEALQQKLEADGWRIQQISQTGGCYRVFAVKADGARLRTEFNVATLEDVRGAEDAQVDAFLSGLQNANGGAGGHDDDDDDDEYEDHEDREDDDD